MLKRILLVGVCPILLFLFSCRKDDHGTPHVTTYRSDGDVVPMLKSVAPNPVNIVILGDGYLKSDLAVGGEFDTRAKEVTDKIFKTAPFNAYKEYFNVYEVAAESKETGTGNGTPNPGSKFSTYISTAPSLITKNTSTLNEYAAKAVVNVNGSANLIILLVNDKAAGASAGQFVVISTGYLNSLIHIIGHTFAGLGDENISASSALLTNKDLAAKFPNLDITDNPAKIKWSSYFQLKSYVSNVGVYEGGYFVSKGVYRPEYTSVMRDVNVLTYNAPSREAIARRICGITGITFNMVDFLEKDKNAIALGTSVVPTGGNGILINDFIDPEQKLKAIQQHPNQ